MNPTNNPAGLIFFVILFAGWSGGVCCVLASDEAWCMPSQTFNQQVVAKLQARILELVGVTKTGGDGESIELADLEKKLAFYEARVARENGSKPRVSSIDLSGSGS